MTKYILVHSIDDPRLSAKVQGRILKVTRENNGILTAHLLDEPETVERQFRDKKFYIELTENQINSKLFNLIGIK